MTEPSIGIQVFPGDGCIQPADLGREVEDRGFAALFFPEHMHMPVHRTIQFVADVPLPEIYKRNLDPFVAFGAIAAVTRLELGTGICLVAQRDPLLLAKTIATLDNMCAGRFSLGVGAGWNIEEMQNHRVDPKSRWDVAREHVEAMRAIWSNDIASFEGAHVRFDDLWSWPKPFEGRRVPVLVGSSRLSRAARWGDGWIPVVDEANVDASVRNIVSLRRQVAELRPHDEFNITVIYEGGSGLKKALPQLADAGANRVLLGIPALPYRDTVRALDDVARDAKLAGWRRS